jgi:hypothetical protein
LLGAELRRDGGRQSGDERVASNEGHSDGEHHA